MKTKKILLGTLSGTVAMFLFGFIIYGVVLSGFMQAHSNPAIARPMDQMLFGVMLLSNAIWAFLFALIIDWSGSNCLAGGAKIGFISGFLAILGLNLSFYSTSTIHNNDMTLLLVDTLAFAMMSGISGAVTGWVMQRVGTPKTAVA